MPAHDFLLRNSWLSQIQLCWCATANTLLGAEFAQLLLLYRREMLSRRKALITLEVITTKMRFNSLQGCLPGLMNIDREPAIFEIYSSLPDVHGDGIQVVD